MLPVIFVQFFLCWRHPFTGDEGFGILQKEAVNSRLGLKYINDDAKTLGVPGCWQLVSSALT